MVTSCQGRARKEPGQQGDLAPPAEMLPGTCRAEGPTSSLARNWRLAPEACCKALIVRNSCSSQWFQKTGVSLSCVVQPFSIKLFDIKRPLQVLIKLTKSWGYRLLKICQDSGAQSTPPATERHLHTREDFCVHTLPTSDNFY